MSLKADTGHCQMKEKKSTIFLPKSESINSIMITEVLPGNYFPVGMFKQTNTPTYNPYLCRYTLLHS